MDSLTVVALIFLSLTCVVEIMGCIKTARYTFTIKHQGEYALIAMIVTVMEVVASEQIAIHHRPRYWLFIWVVLAVVYITYFSYYAKWLDTGGYKQTPRQAAILIATNLVSIGMVLWLAFGLRELDVRRAQTSNLFIFK